MKKYYSLVTLENGLWAVQFGDYDKQVVKQEKQDSYHGTKSRIITTEETQESIDKAVKLLNEAQAEKTQKAQLSIFTISDIVATMQQNTSYQHTAIFNNKADAITFINNFTGYMSRNGLNGKFSTALAPCVINDELFYLTVFSMKATD
jgi:hypothetical protein